MYIGEDLHVHVAASRIVVCTTIGFTRVDIALVEALRDAGKPAVCGSINSFVRYIYFESTKNRIQGDVQAVALFELARCESLGYVRGQLCHAKGAELERSCREYELHIFKLIIQKNEKLCIRECVKARKM